MNTSIHGERIGRLLRTMESQDWDFVLATSPENVFYLSGAFIHTQTFMRRRQTAVLVTRDGEATLIVAEVEKSLATRMSQLANLVTYKEHSASVCLTAIALLGRRTPPGRVLAIEKTHLPALDFEDLARHLPSVRLVDADAQLAELRLIKSVDEVSSMNFAAGAMEDAILNTAKNTKAGAREEVIATEISERVYRIAGARARSATGLVASGKNLTVQHHVGDTTQLQPGNFVRLGCRSVIDGYHAMVVRTAVVGEGSAASLDHYARLHRAHAHLLSSLRPGARARDVFEQAVSTRNALGVNVGLVHVGYAVGLEFMENPKLAAGSDDVLQAGMTLLATTNSRSSDPHDPGLRYIVDMVILEEQGARLLTGAWDTSRPIPLNAN